jgi:hypothetical protein
MSTTVTQIRKNGEYLQIIPLSSLPYKNALMGSDFKGKSRIDWNRRGSSFCRSDTGSTCVTEFLRAGPGIA